MSNSRRRNELRAQREDAYRAEEEAQRQRIREVWQVPEHAAEAFVKLQDAVGDAHADAIAEFIQAMLEKADTP